MTNNKNKINVMPFFFTTLPKATRRGWPSLD